MKKIEINDLFLSLEKLGINREEIFLDQTLKLIQNHWKNIVGDLFADQSYPVSFKDSKLIVMCKHSLISQELEFMKRDMLSKIKNLKLPLSVEKIQLKSGHSLPLKR